MVRAEAAEEVGVGDEAAPAGADEGRAGEGGRQRGEAEEDLGEEVVDVDRGRPAADHLVPCRLGRPKINRKGSVGEDARGGQTPTPASGQQGRGVLVVHDAGDGAAGGGSGEKFRYLTSIRLTYFGIKIADFS